MKKIHATVLHVRKKKSNPFQIVLPFDLINAPEDIDLMSLDKKAAETHQNLTTKTKSILEIKNYCRRCSREHKAGAKCPRRVVY